MYHPNLASRPDKALVNKKTTCHLVVFDVPTNHRVRIKESEKIDKYLDLTRELKNLWKLKVKVILIVVCALEIILKGLEKRLGELEIRRTVEIG